MSDYIEDRRLERRYPSAGEARFHLNGYEFRGQLLDVSVNGLRTTRPEGFELAEGDRLKVTLSPNVTGPLQAEVAIVHLGADQIGFEFQNIAPHEFWVLSLMLADQERKSLNARFDS